MVVVVVLMVLTVAAFVWSNDWSVLAAVKPWILPLTASLTTVTGLVLVIRDTLVIRRLRQLVAQNIRCLEDAEARRALPVHQSARVRHGLILSTGTILLLLAYSTSGLTK
jgi:hypothetical protein